MMENNDGISGCGLSRCSFCAAAATCGWAKLRGSSFVKNRRIYWGGRSFSRKAKHAWARSVECFLRPWRAEAGLEGQSRIISISPLWHVILSIFLTSMYDPNVGFRCVDIDFHWWDVIKQVNEVICYLTDNCCCFLVAFVIWNKVSFPAFSSWDLSALALLYLFILFWEGNSQFFFHFSMVFGKKDSLLYLRMVECFTPNELLPPYSISSSHAKILIISFNFEHSQWLNILLLHFIEDVLSFLFMAILWCSFTFINILILFQSNLGLVWLFKSWLQYLFLL